MNNTSLPLNALPADFFEGRLENAYDYLGCHPLPDGSTRFAVWAPNAAAVSLVGDFNGWQVGKDPLLRGSDGIWTLTLSGLKSGDLYKYAITWASGKVVLKADPYGFYHEAAPGTASRVWVWPEHIWHDAAYLRAREKKHFLSRPMSVYEVHLGSWRHPSGGASYRSIALPLAQYCRDMGYTHVELLPLTEYPYEPSWGYQVTGYFAPTARYGAPSDFMYFVDTLHAHGLGVIMDWVPAHFPKDAHGLGMFDGSPAYERKNEKMADHPEWGTRIFDYESGPVCSFLLSSAAFFLERYHVDALRVDAVSSMLYLSYGRGGDFIPNRLGGDIDLGAVEFLRRLTAAVRRRHCLSIAEESSAYPGVTHPVQSGGLGFDLKWDMGFMHDTLDYMKLDPIYRSAAHNKLTFSMMYAYSEKFMLAFSHDEVVHCKGSMISRMSGLYDDKFANLRALLAFQYAHPGKKHNFMGTEIAQFNEWNEQSQLDWFLLDYPRHRQLQDFVRRLNRVYRSRPALWENEVDWDGFKWLNVNDSDRSSVAFMRISRKGEKLVCAFNFTPVEWELQVGLPAAGRLWLVLSSDEERFGGQNRAAARLKSSGLSFLDHPDSAFIKLPPLSAVYYSYKETEK